MIESHKRTRAQESSNAIERMYITMRHLFNRGFYKPMGVSGETLREALLELRPEIYGSIGEDKAELEGLSYVLDRLPIGIEECRFINLTSDEGFGDSHFEVIIPRRRRRNCYRIDEEQMNIEVTRGRSEIYDILTHLTFLFIESHKLARAVLINDNKNTTRDWKKIEAIATSTEIDEETREVGITHLASVMSRTFEEIRHVYPRFATLENPDRFLHFIYNLGRLAIDEVTGDDKRTVTFSAVLRERLGHHIHGARWARNIKTTLEQRGWLQRPLHIISSNLHSVMNVLHAQRALPDLCAEHGVMETYSKLSEDSQGQLRQRVTDEALAHGMIYIKDRSGANIDVQLFDLAQDVFGNAGDETAPVLIVMDYAFGEQAYEVMDELLRSYETDAGTGNLNVKSINIMGKAGILDGNKGDIMIPNAHLFEGTADNYPFKNQLSKSDFEGQGVPCVKGTMITVLGTSLQNRDILEFFKASSWNVMGLEMEGAHYQKAIQAASRIRMSIKKKVDLRYAYYASDNPLMTGHTLASGGLGLTGVRPVYLITETILKQIQNNQPKPTIDE